MKKSGQCTPTGGRFFYLLLFLSVPAPLSQALGIMVFNHISSGFAPAGCTAVDRDKAPALEILHIFTTGNAQRTVIYKSCRDIIVFYSIFIAGDAGRIGFCRFRAVTKIRCLTCLKGFPSKPGISLGTRPRKGNAPESFFAAQGHSKCMSRLEAAADHVAQVEAGPQDLQPVQVGSGNMSRQSPERVSKQDQAFLPAKARDSRPAWSSVRLL